LQGFCFLPASETLEHFYEGNADVVAAINIKELGRSSLACGESEKNAQAQVNSGRSKKPAPNQQQESTEVISNASC
jgi:putative transposase